MRAIPLVVLPCSSVPLQSQPSQLVIENHADPIVWGPPKWALLEAERSASSSRRANAYHLSNSSPGPVPSTDSAELGAEIFDNASHGVWVLSAKSAQVIVTVLAYHPSTFRSQSFSPSQRFDPTRALWFCFAPHPPIGFLAYRVFPSQPAVVPSGTRYSLVVEPAPHRPVNRTVLSRLPRLLLRISVELPVPTQSSSALPQGLRSASSRLLMWRTTLATLVRGRTAPRRYDAQRPSG